MKKLAGIVAVAAVTGFVHGLAVEAAKKPGAALGDKIQNWMSEDR